MSIWRTQPVSEQPVIELSSWQVFSVPAVKGDDFDRHFNGYNFGEGRVSSKIVEFDSTNMIGTTRSGRKYQLVGGPGNNPDAEYVMSRWLGLHHINRAEVVDVTSEYQPREQETADSHDTNREAQ